MHPHLNVTGLPPANETIKVGHKLRFKCDTEYTMNGPEEIECLQTGKWNAPFPTCDGMFTFTEAHPIYIYFIHLFICIFDYTHLFRQT